MWYNWERGRTVAKQIKERRDKCVCTSDWLHLFLGCILEQGIRYKFDLACVSYHPLTKSNSPKEEKMRFLFCDLLDVR